MDELADDVARFAALVEKEGIPLEAIQKDTKTALAFLKLGLWVAFDFKNVSLEEDFLKDRLKTAFFKPYGFTQISTDDFLDSAKSHQLISAEGNRHSIFFSYSNLDGALFQSLFEKEADRLCQCRAAKRKALQDKNRAIHVKNPVFVDPEADARWMRRALELSSDARRAGEVPVGAVLVCENRILAEGFNRTISKHDPTAHAEIEAIRSACRKVGNERLTESTLYVTLEPCPMCAAAIANARIRRVVWGADDPKMGAMRSKGDLAGTYQMNHRASVTSGVLGDRCTRELRSFFCEKRGEGKA